MTRNRGDIDCAYPAFRQSAVGQRHDRRDDAGARDPVCRAEPRVQLPWPARQPGQSPGQSRSADADLPARGARRRTRTRLGQGHGPADGGHPARQCRADARRHGDLQRLVRPGSDGHLRRDGAGRRRKAPAVDRLDTHGARSGGDRPALRQMGRPAGQPAGVIVCHGSCTDRRLDRAARPDLCPASTSRCRKPRRRTALRCRIPVSSHRPNPHPRQMGRSKNWQNCWKAPKRRSS